MLSETSVIAKSVPISQLTKASVTHGPIYFTMHVVFLSRNCMCRLFCFTKLCASFAKSYAMLCPIRISLYITLSGKHRSLVCLVCSRLSWVDYHILLST